jgi:hypothetical protein
MRKLSILILLTLCLTFILSKSELEYLRTEDNTTKKPPIFIGDSLHDYLYDLSKEQLKILALALDYYHVKSDETGKETLKIEQHSEELSANFLREFIAKEVNEHPEINEITKIEKVVDEYKNIQEIKKYLNTLSRDDLVTMSLKCERQHKISLGMEHSLGGLHDYIWHISDDQIRDYIIKESQEHEELNSANKLSLLLIRNNEKPKNDEDENEKNIEAIIKNLSKPFLMKIVPMILKKIDTEIFNVKLNYNYMTTENLRNFVKFLITDFKLNKDEILKEIKDILNDHTRAHK